MRPQIYQTFEKAFPQCTGKLLALLTTSKLDSDATVTANKDFFLGKLGNQYGQGGQKWEENMLHGVGLRKTADLETFVIGNDAKLAKRKQ
jgi:hypothetical protein